MKTIQVMVTGSTECLKNEARCWYEHFVGEVFEVFPPEYYEAHMYRIVMGNEARGYSTKWGIYMKDAKEVKLLPLNTFLPEELFEV